MTRKHHDGANPKPYGLRLVGPAVWMIDMPPGVPEVLEALVPILPPDAVLYIEATSVSPHLKALFLRRAAKANQPVAPALQSSKPRYFHILATPATLREIATLIRQNPSAAWGHDIQLYDAQGIFAAWYDADTGWPLHLSQRILLPDAVAIARRLGRELLDRAWPV